MSEEKTEETEKRQHKETTSTPLVKANTVRRKAEGRQKSPPTLSPEDRHTLNVKTKVVKGGEKY